MRRYHAVPRTKLSLSVAIAKLLDLSCAFSAKARPSSVGWKSPFHPSMARPVVAGAARPDLASVSICNAWGETEKLMLCRVHSVPSKYFDAASTLLPSDERRWADSAYAGDGNRDCTAGRVHQHSRLAVCPTGRIQPSSSRRHTPRRGRPPNSRRFRIFGSRSRYEALQQDSGRP